MSGIKKLAGQTMLYGGSSIIARLLNYLLTPYLTLKMSEVGYGEISMIYAAIPFLNVLFTYGLETAFFKFSEERDGRKVFATSSLSIMYTTLMFCGLLVLFHKQLAIALKLQDHPEYILMIIGIIALDTLTTLPYALLRQQGKPVKFATIRITNILVTMALTYFFISILPQNVATKPKGLLRAIYIENFQVGYVILANLIASAIQFLQLGKEFFAIKMKPDMKLWKEMMAYSMPMLIVGMGGMINEVADRNMLAWLAPAATDEGKKSIVAIYGACYKLSILITLFIQGFRMGAEPFFFKQAQGSNPQRTYARVMKFFVITICIMFLVIVLYIDIWKHFLRNPYYWQGLGVVPILVVANMCLGVYYNLSIWYKLGKRTLYGAYITLIGAAVTLGINFLFIPTFSYYACAWATLLAYASMMIISYVWGQKVYPVPYATRKLLSYFVMALIAYCLYMGFCGYVANGWLRFLAATVLLIFYVWLLTTVEHKEFAKLPVIGKYFAHPGTKADPLPAEQETYEPSVLEETVEEQQMKNTDQSKNLDA